MARKKQLEGPDYEGEDISIEQRREQFLQMKKSIKDDWRMLKANSTEHTTPYGFLALDAALRLQGIYGRGRIVGIHGNEFSGKSSMAYGICRNYQRQTGKPVAIFDFERTSTSKYLRDIGLDEDMALVYMPDNIEEGIELTLKSLKAGVQLLIFDSIPRMEPRLDMKNIIKNGLGKERPGEHARAMKEFYKAVLPFAAQYDASLIMINQMRARIEMTPEALRAQKYPSYTNLPYILPGGRATRFAASVMIELSTKKAYQKGGYDPDNAFVLEPGDKKGPFVATEVGVRILKNKTNGGGLCGSSMWHRPGIGFDENISIRQMAKNLNLISYIGKRYVVGENADEAIKVYDSKEDAVEDLVIKQNQDVLLPLRDLVIKNLVSSNAAIESLDASDELVKYASGESDEFDILESDL